MSNLIKSSDIQPEDDLARDVARRHDAKVKAGIVTMIGSMAELFGSTAVVRALRALDRPALNAVLDSPEMRDLFITGYTPIMDTFDDAARLEAANMNMAIGRGASSYQTAPALTYGGSGGSGGGGDDDGGEGSGGGGEPPLPGGNVRLLTYDPLTAMLPLQDLRTQLDKTLTESARAAVSDALAASARGGIAPEIIAQRLQTVIGLDTRDQRAVQNYRRMLETGDPTALRRVLREERYDRVVREAMNAKRALNPEQIDALVAARIENGIAHRAETIARTESMQAAVSGIRAPYVQAVENGRLFDSEVKRYWLTAADELVCPVCRSIPILNRKGIGVNEEYASIDGFYDAPIAHPRCRCSERYVTNLSRVTETPFRLAA